MILRSESFLPLAQASFLPWGAEQDWGDVCFISELRRAMQSKQVEHMERRILTDRPRHTVSHCVLCHAGVTGVTHVARCQEFVCVAMTMDSKKKQSIEVR